MKHTLLYRLCFFPVFAFTTLVVESQIIKNTEKREFSEDSAFYKLYDSIEHKGSFKNSITFSISNLKKLYLVKDSLHWKGFIVRFPVNDYNYPGNQIDAYGNEIKAVKFISYTFNGDSLYKFLLGRNIYGLNQLTDEDISDMYSKRKNKKGGLKYMFGHSSHPAEIILTTFKNSKMKVLQYELLLLENKELHFIPTIKTLYLLNKLLTDY